MLEFAVLLGNKMLARCSEIEPRPLRFAPRGRHLATAETFYVRYAYCFFYAR